MHILAIETALKSLELLLASDTAQEADYQAFFEENPAAFAVLGYTNVYPHLALRTKDRDLLPDFFVKRCFGTFEICEIKTPEEKLLKETKTALNFTPSSPANMRRRLANMPNSSMTKPTEPNSSRNTESMFQNAPGSHSSSVVPKS